MKQLGKGYVGDEAFLFYFTHYLFYISLQLIHGIEKFFRVCRSQSSALLLDPLRAWYWKNTVTNYIHPESQLSHIICFHRKFGLFPNSKPIQPTPEFLHTHPLSVELGAGKGFWPREIVHSLDKHRVVAKSFLRLKRRTYCTFTKETAQRKPKPPG